MCARVLLSPRATAPLFITSRMCCLLKKFVAMNQGPASDHCTLVLIPRENGTMHFTSETLLASFLFLFRSQITRLRFRGRCLLEYFAVNEHYEIFIIRAKDDARKLLTNKWLKVNIPGLRVAVRTIAFVEIQKMLPPYISARLYKAKDFSGYDRRSRPEN